MYEVFERLKQEKQDAVICAALEEFAGKGYTLASTNEMVKAAGISKGALFHYFGDKKALFLYLCDLAVHLLEEEYFAPVSGAGGDLMRRLELAVALKMKLLTRYQKLFAFCAQLLTEQAGEVVEEVHRFQAAMLEAQHQALFEGLDPALLKEGIPPQEGNKMLWWILEGYSAELSSRYQGRIPEQQELDESVCEFERFQALVRSIFYRQERDLT